MLPVAVDAMGGDRAPVEIVAGAREAAELHGIPVVLVGRADDIGDAGGLSVLPASDVVGMGEDGARAVRTRKDSSVVRAAEAVRDGHASAMVSAGNTGAAVASALLRFGRIKGVARPAIATALPVPGATPTLLLDSGANAECQAAWLVQFARMGAAFSTSRYGIEAPRVGLLSIGEEPGKGSALVKETFAALSAVAATSALNFIGNVEGRDLLSDRVDVVVTDGFTGNVALKALEGAMRFLVAQVMAAFGSSEEAKQAAEVLLPALGPLYEELDPETTGGSMLLGVDGVCIISHGSSSRRAIVSALLLARDMVEGGLVDRLKAAVVA